MKLLLDTLLFIGVCWLGAAMGFTTMANFNKQRVVGNWYPLANIVIEKKFHQYTLKATSKGLQYSYKYLDEGKCKTRTTSFNEQGGRGNFKGSSTTFAKILDTDYATYLISYIERGMDSFLTLAGKEATMSSDLQTKFREVATAAGVTGDIVPLAPEESCNSGRRGR